MRRWVGWSCLGALVCASAALAQPGDEDALGFDSVEPTTAAPAAEQAERSTTELLFGAMLRLDAAMRVERSPLRLAKLRQVIAPHLDFKADLGAGARLRLRASGRSEVDFAYLLWPERYDEASRSVYAWQLLPGENYIALDWGAWTFSFGKQIVNWAQVNLLTLLDVISPRDMREPLLADASELHLPVLMTRIGLNVDPVRVELVIVHEPWFGLSPPPLGEFSGLRRLQRDSGALGAGLDDRVLVNEHIPAHALDDLGATQFHGRIGWVGQGFDLALIASSLLDPGGVPSLPAPDEFGDRTLALPIAHPRYTMLAHSGAMTFGAWVLRWEAALDIDRTILLERAGTMPLMWKNLQLDIAHGVAGIGYSPSALTSFGFEVSGSYVFDSPARDPGARLKPLFPIELPQFAFTVSQRLLSDRLTLIGFVLLIGAPWHANALAARIDVLYALSDSLQLGLGYVTYQPSDRFGFFYGFDDLDTVFLGLRWDVGD